MRTFRYYNQMKFLANTDLTTSPTFPSNIFFSCFHIHQAKVFLDQPLNSNKSFHGAESEGLSEREERGNMESGSERGACNGGKGVGASCQQAAGNCLEDKCSKKREKKQSGMYVELQYKKPKKTFMSKEEKQKFVQSYLSKEKTELCKNWEVYGWCKYGDSCSFAHGVKELRSRTDLRPIYLSLIHICRCRRSTLCRSRWSPYH
eukprot:TRINITY_DN2027_c0_g1_i15.p1 TRINITY_DN2027_c0_g1~~TRINITY_DN2027_c0_g1_i15.p1  ORF type:complete len:204 (+),score=40.39 TRINITY_DN2027_c0_g1_i15:152-763(+)